MTYVNRLSLQVISWVPDACFQLLDGQNGEKRGIVWIRRRKRYASTKSL